MSLRDDPRVERVLHPETEVGKLLRDVTATIVVISVLGLLLFALGGVWPPFVSITSGSMEPEMQRGDLILIENPQRDTPPGSHGETGIMTAEMGEDSDFESFNGDGDVIVFRPDGSTSATTITHRAQFWVDEGENWYERADPDLVAGTENCDQLLNCPAPHPGFVTKGDANNAYDQAVDFSEPVKPQWVVGEANVRIPFLGWVRIIIA